MFTNTGFARFVADQNRSPQAKILAYFSPEVSSANSMLFHKIYTFYFHQLTENGTF